MEAKDKEYIIELIDKTRKEKILAIQEEASIEPNRWDKVDAVMGDLLNELVALHTVQLTILMELLAEADINAPVDIHVLLTKANIDAVLYTGILAAHFTVSEEHGRQVNDAHLHLERVARAAEQVVGVDMRVITNSKKGG